MKNYVCCAMKAGRHVVLWVMLCGAASLSVATELSLVGEIDGRSVPFAGVEQNQILVRDGAETKPAPAEVSWRLEGDLAAQADLVNWFPRHTINRPAELEILGRQDMYENVGIVWEGLETDILGSAQQRENPFLKNWKSGPAGTAVIVAVWLLERRAVKVQLLALPPGSDAFSFHYRFSFVLSREESAGQPALLLWYNGTWVKPAPFFRHAATQRAFVATLLDDVPALEKALQSGAKLKEVSPTGVNLAQIAATVGAERTLEHLLRLNPPFLNDPGKGFNAPLSWAALAGRANTARLLLAAKAKPTAIGREINPLNVAATNGHVDVVREFVRVGVYQDRKGGSLLQGALSDGQAEIAECLLAAGATYDFPGPVRAGHWWMERAREIRRW